uniref:uncharacterized protein LOC122604805 n=1 Tax=Erigeron canadensis TaxID=72917 RepID=UPI001CB94511|nr:uncharacterized protein LOC122604805 [Erigeron canadensis]
MAWIRSAMNKAAEEVRGRSSFGDAVRSHTGYNVVRNPGPNRAAQNMRSYKEAIRRLEEASICFQGEKRAQLLRRWIVCLKEIERLDAGSAVNDEKISEEPNTSSVKYDVPDVKEVNVTRLDMNIASLVLYYDQDLGVSPVNFRDVFLHSQALEGITMSTILGAPNEEEVFLLKELFGLCLTGDKEVHEVIVKRILDLSKAFSVYDDEVLAKKSELLDFVQSAIAGLKVNCDILRIDSEVSEVHQNLKRFESQELLIESDGSSLDATNNATLEVIKESVSPIRLCCRLESLLLMKRLLNTGDTAEAHSHKVDKLKVLSESLLSSASKTEKRISDHRQQKEEALHFRVAKTSEVSQIEKDLAAEISVLEKQRDELEAELQQVKSSLTAANARLQNAREEREQFDDANNQLLVDFKSKDDELSKAIVSYRAEADTCSACVDFLEATWAVQSSITEKKEKNVNDELETLEEYIVNVARSLLSAYKDALEPAILNVKKHMKNLKRYEKAIDPDEEFLQDIEQRKALEEAYLAAETKVLTIFDAADSVKELFYHTFDNVSRKGIEPVNEMCDAIEKFKVDFEALPRPPLRYEKSAEGENMSSKEYPGKGAPPTSKLVLAVDLKSILTQKLVPRAPNIRPYIPLGGSPENSPSKQQIEKTTPVEDNETKTIDIEKESREPLIMKHDAKIETTESQESSISQPSTSEDKKFLELSTEVVSKKVVNPDIAEYEHEKTLVPSTSDIEYSSLSSTGEGEKLADTDEETANSG